MPALRRLIAPLPARLIAPLIAPLAAASARARQRRSLLNLDARLLADVGLTPGQALDLTEGRPLSRDRDWSAPLHWQTAPVRPTCG